MFNPDDTQGTSETRRVTVVGSINVDVIVRAPRLPAAGETLLGSSVIRRPGGKGANQAVALARLGVPVSLIGAIGADADGAFSLSSLTSVDVTGVRTVDVPTGIALITVDDRGENTIVVVPGANTLAVAPAAADTLVTQLELPLPVVTAAVSGATGLVVLNAAPALPLPESLLERVDVLVVNQGEALAVSGRPVVEEALDYLQARVRRGVVVTLGAAGCLVRTAEGSVHIHGRPVVAVDTVGAGDAFVAALTWGLLSGRDLPHAAEDACVAGALAVTCDGARTSPTLDQLERALTDE